MRRVSATLRLPGAEYRTTAGAGLRLFVISDAAARGYAVMANGGSDRSVFHQQD